jgi:hypothetical protein
LRIEETWLVERATLILALADGERPSHIASRRGCTRAWCTPGLRDSTPIGLTASRPSRARAVPQRSVRLGSATSPSAQASTRRRRRPKCSVTWWMHHSEFLYMLLHPFVRR